MLAKAIEKISDEMALKNNNSYVQVVGDFLLKHVGSHPESAEKILVEDKTIEKSLKAMEDVARKNKMGNCAVLSDAEGFAVVLDYFGIQASKIGQAQPAPKAEFDVSLDELLAEKE